MLTSETHGSDSRQVAYARVWTITRIDRGQHNERRERIVFPSQNNPAPVWSDETVGVWSNGLFITNR